MIEPSEVNPNPEQNDSGPSAGEGAPKLRLSSLQRVNLALGSGLPMAAKMLLVALASHDFNSSSPGVVWPSNAALLAKSSMSPNTLKKHTKALEKAGWFQREERQGKVTLYHLTDWTNLVPIEEPQATETAPESQPAEEPQAESVEAPEQAQPAETAPAPPRAPETDKAPEPPSTPRRKTLDTLTDEQVLALVHAEARQSAVVDVAKTYFEAAYDITEAARRRHGTEKHRRQTWTFGNVRAARLFGGLTEEELDVLFQRFRDALIRPEGLDRHCSYLARIAENIQAEAAQTTAQINAKIAEIDKARQERQERKANPVTPEMIEARKKMAREMLPAFFFTNLDAPKTKEG